MDSPMTNANVSTLVFQWKDVTILPNCM